MLRSSCSHLRGFMRLRRRLRLSGDGDLRAAGVERLGNRLDEALRRTGDEGELHVVPVGAYRVVDDRPALQGRGAIGLARKDHAVGDFQTGTSLM